MKESTLLSIKEFSDFTGVSQSTLRYYDEIGLLPPAVRGDNNYRYYVPFQIIKLNYISVFVNLGVPLSTIKEMDADRTPESVIGLLGRQEGKINYQLYELQTAYSIIHTFRENIQAGLSVRDGEMGIEELDESHYVLGRTNNFIEGDTFYEEFVRFCQTAEEYRINLRFPIGGHHDDIDSFMRVPNRPDRFFSQDPLGNRVRPGGKYLVGYRQDYYGEFGDLPERMAGYAEEHNLVFKGPVHVIYLFDEVSMTEPGQYLSRISVNVSKKKEPRTRKAQL